jgi:hypothetical protein
MVVGREAGGERRLQLIKVLALLQSALIIIDGLENCSAMGARLQSVMDEVQTEIASSEA